MEILQQPELEKKVVSQKNLMAQACPTLLQSIGNTPLVRLEFDTKPTILAKLEYANPGGSVKDRSAYFMVKDAEDRGLLQPGGTIIEASSGNQGIALAMIGAVKGYKVKIVVPSRTSKEKRATLQAYGAELIVCPEGMTSAEHAKALHAQAPGSFMPNQYFNPANIQAHYATTGPEIWKQTKGQLTHFVVGAGSCGTISGTAKYLKEQNPNIKIIGVDAADSAYSSEHPKAYKAEGMGIDYPYGLFDKSIIDLIVPVTDEDAFEATRFYAIKYGILGGISSGAVLKVTHEFAKTAQESDVIVCLLADSGRAYLSKVFGLD